ncbi:DUF481 domain-containing protein [Pseudoxanthomonas dokdonensis]|uniref:DUF481 domain-containing protein n=1 Tax=Pseudoxanthomonas dokdonensis TaxID=344882 RepID=UPI0009FADBD4|nr:DUF481 domain-containing protein [Pseudoxanthomonas dokdonensis]
MVPDNTKSAASLAVVKSVGKPAPVAKAQLFDKHGTPQIRKPQVAIEAAPQAPHWSGGGEFGYASAKGNSNTESLNGKLDFKYSQGLWKHSANVTALRSSSEYMRIDDDGSVHSGSNTTANRYALGINSGYSMDERGTLNATYRQEKDDFGSFSRQRSLAFSYGNRVVDGDRVQLDLQFGPGYRRAYDTVQQRMEASVIGRGLADFRVGLTDNTEVVNKLLVESGKYNTFAQNDLGVSVTMNSHLALKAGWQARHNSDVEADDKRTDTLTTMNVVYRFK